MNIYDETKSIVLTKEQCDVTKGYLYPEKKIVGYRPSLVEKTINAYGSITTKTYNKFEIEEDILVYKPYTQKQLYVINGSSNFSLLLFSFHDYTPLIFGMAE